MHCNTDVIHLRNDAINEVGNLFQNTRVFDHICGHDHVYNKFAEVLGGWENSTCKPFYFSVILTEPFQNIASIVIENGVKCLHCVSILENV